MNSAFQIREYVENGRSLYREWFESLDNVTAERVDKSIRRLEVGNFGAAKPLRQGVFELRMEFGPGYRIYYGLEGGTIIILLGGGSKRRQDTDIAAAAKRWKECQQRKTSMALARDYRETVMRRDLVPDGVTFKALTRQTGLGEKSLQRKKSRRAVTLQVTGILGAW